MYDLADHPADRAAAPIVGEYWDQPGPNSVSWHSHRRGQLIYAQRGCVRVQTDDALFVVPPHRAVWVPPETEHAAHYPREVAFRGLFVIARLCKTLPQRPTVMQVDSLTRELIDAAVRLPWDYPDEGREQRLMAVLMDRLVALPATPLRLPEGHDDQVRRVMQALRDDPADNRSLGLWARSVNLSERTLTRRFVDDTGMSFGAWRQQLRLTLALERLAAGEAVTTVAIDLGYGTPSSFTTMFRKALGMPPSAYFS
ncbi:AraC family transcriptional regulator [Pelagibius sp.]|uniref:AraC family transcriptional regulator n=1 Tax=Pelagibius sp. TaxID=1931238 RepID=UPI003BB05C3E